MEELKNYLDENFILEEMGGKLDLNINDWLEEFKNNFINRKKEMN